jgi:serine/threonine protein kinase
MAFPNPNPLRRTSHERSIVRNSMSLAPGTRLGPYEILAPAGSGGMGDVYKARDTRLDRIVAIKVSKEQFSARFEQEARAVAALSHPHICQLYLPVRRKARNDDQGHNRET